MDLQTALDWVRQLEPVPQAAVAGCFTWAVTAFGASGVLLQRSFPRTLLDAMLGFAAGVMIAASFRSLLAPSIEMAESQGMPGWLPAAVGFALGTGFLWTADQILPHLHPFREEAEGRPSSLERSGLLVLAITLHNIPEGLAVGVSFGAASTAAGGVDPAQFGSAVALG